jgi:hypothetical protein
VNVRFDMSIVESRQSAFGQFSPIGESPLLMKSLPKPDRPLPTGFRTFSDSPRLLILPSLSFLPLVAF